MLFSSPWQASPRSRLAVLPEVIASRHQRRFCTARICGMPYENGSRLSTVRVVPYDGAPSHIQSEHWCTPQKLLKLPFLLKHCNGSRSAQVQNRLDLKELQELDAFTHTIASLESLLLFHGVALRPPDNRIKLLKGQVVCLFRFVFQNRPFSSQARHVQQLWPSAELVKEHPEALRF
jgi:hypothetical protein